MDSIDIFLYVADVLVIVGVILAVVLPLIKSLDDPKSLLKSALAVVALAVLFFIAYSISDGEVTAKFAQAPFNLTEGMSKFVGGSLIMTYIMTLVALAGIVITEITKAIK
jgi:NADH:ubiquinone oxidoreductase subunit 6 (subunit J)